MPTSSTHDPALDPAPASATESAPESAPESAHESALDSAPDTGSAGVPVHGERPGDSFVQSFARGLAVIRAFDAQRPSQTLSEVAAAAGLTRAAARRILLTLQTLGYVDADGRQFRLTAKILDLGFAYLTSMPIWNLAEPVMEHLVAQVHESCSASVLDRTDIVYVLRVPTQKIIAINLATGSRLPAFCTSMGRVLLAGLDEARLDEVLAASELRQRTPRTVTDTKELKRIIAQVREQNWAIVDQELEVGLISLSAPIRDRQGRIIAAMNVSGNAQRSTAKQMIRDFLPPLQAAAQRVSALVALRG
jgi:IclR family transcriptional regulator, pca regulon regulatory protein